MSLQANDTHSYPGKSLSKPLDSFMLAAFAAQIAESKKAQDTIVLDTAQVSNLADFFIICSCESTAQLVTISESIEKQFKALGYHLMGVRPDRSKTWRLLDYGDVVVHVMNSTERAYYQLEVFWNHADFVPRALWQAQLPEAG
ncbi:MAG: ribosome silencing factor [Cyanobacteria bacterium P01_H01_bin.74]